MLPLYSFYWIHIFSGVHWCPHLSWSLQWQIPWWGLQQCHRHHHEVWGRDEENCSTPAFPLPRFNNHFNNILESKLVLVFRFIRGSEVYVMDINTSSPSPHRWGMRKAKYSLVILESKDPYTVILIYVSSWICFRTPSVSLDGAWVKTLGQPVPSHKSRDGGSCVYMQDKNIIDEYWWISD